MADKWDTIRAYARTGSTTGVTAFEAANPGLSTADLEQFQKDYPQVTVAGRALARRRSGAGAGAGASAPSGSTTVPVSRGGATGPLQTPAPTPFTPNRAAVGPEPDRLPTPKQETFSRNLVHQLKAVDSRAAVIPTPGDLGPWILALVFLLFAVVPFNGYTRLQLIWMALIGTAHVPDFLDGLGQWVRHVAGSSAASSGGSTQGGSIAQPPPGSGSGSGTTPPLAPKQEAPGGFTPRSVAGGGL